MSHTHVRDHSVGQYDDDERQYLRCEHALADELFVNVIDGRLTTRHLGCDLLAGAHDLVTRAIATAIHTKSEPLPPNTMHKR